MAASCSTNGEPTAPPLRAYRISVEFCASALPFDLDDDLRRSEPQDYEYGDHPYLAACEAEVVAELEPIFRHLQRLGCISAGPAEPSGRDGAEATPQHFLVTVGELSAPREPLPWRKDGPLEPLLAARTSRCFAAYPDVELHSCASVEEVELLDAYQRLRSLSSDHELSCWGGERTVERLPRDGETAEVWAMRIAVPSDRLAEACDRLARVGCDLDLYSLFLDDHDTEEADYVVDKMIPFCALTLLVGSGMAGKSSVAHELLSAVSAKTGPKSFLGQPVTGRYPGVLISGEETRRAIKIRTERHGKVWGGADVLFVEAAGPADLAEALTKLEVLPDNSVLVVDPATLYMDGDDTKSHVVNEFYKPLLAFAKRKKAAVLVVHHLVKDPPKALSRILPSVRGAAVHTDRVRMVIALIDRGNGTVGVGTIKHNLPEGAWKEINEEQFCRRDSETYRLLPIDAELPRSPPPDETVLDVIYRTVSRLNGEGRTVHRTGNSGLFRARAPELQGLPRNSIEERVLRLLDSGKLISTSKGLVALPVPT